MWRSFYFILPIDRYHDINLDFSLYRFLFEVGEKTDAFWYDKYLAIIHMPITKYVLLYYDTG